jgi:hypothetical protein
VKINNKIKISLLLIIIIIISFFSINSIIEDNKFQNLKSLLSNQQKEFIKKYFFPHKHWSYQFKKELKFKKSEKDIEITKSSIELSNNKNLKKYKLNSGFHAGIHNFLPGSGYIDFYNNDIFILSARGVLVFRKNLIDDNENFKQIKNNINDFISIEQFKKHRWFSLKDLLIYKNKVYVSYTEEIKEDCWNTSIIQGDINYENIEFKKLFSSDKCVHSIKNVDKEFNGSQSGGKIASFDDSNILVSVGDYRSRHFAQDRKSINGKIIKININNGEHQIVSMGHRNPQGLYFDKENNFILETEHGPDGGDEINLIEVDKFNEGKIQNYGWAIASAGEHYGGKVEKNKEKYRKYPLYKSHSEYGFVEPLKSFVPSIAISAIIKVEKNKYVASSMKKDNSLYFFTLNTEKKISNLKKIEVFERVRDLKFNDGKLYLFMEDSASIGVLNIR